ncbi:MAG: hypothetical protein D6746_00540 [Bacteroidetes bacterium]|nr:MAG: hypothetical protein D6746_00540 [Bacteroidota bacterium]
MADSQQLVSQMTSEAGQFPLQLADSKVMLKARHLYCTKFYTLAQVAKALKLPRQQVERWASIFDWHALRQKREFKIYQRINKIRKIAPPNIDVRHDQIFANLEGLIEDTVQRLQNRDDVDPEDIKILVQSMKQVQESRRLIHKKETSHRKKTVEITNNSELFQAILDGIVGSVGKPLPESHRIEEPVKEAEFEVKDDLDK